MAVLITDEGVNGLDVHLVNDTADAVDGTLVLALHTATHRVERATRPVVVPARGGVSVRADSLFDGFRDLTYAYCFGPRSYELVTVDLLDASGDGPGPTGLPARGAGPGPRSRRRASGARSNRPMSGAWLLQISTRRFAEYVQVDVPGFVAGRFVVPPAPGGLAHDRPATRAGAAPEPRGRVRALNSSTVAPSARDRTAPAVRDELPVVQVLSRI